MSATRGAIEAASLGTPAATRLASAAMRRRATTRRLRRTMLAGVALFAVGDRGPARRHQRLRPRRALDRRHALRDPRRAARPEGRRRRRDRRRDVRRAEGALAVLAPDVRPRARGITRDRPKAIAYDVEFVETPATARTTSRPTTRSCSPARSAGNVMFSATAVEQGAARRTSSAASRATKFARRDGRQRAAARGHRRACCGALPYEIDGLKTLSVATVERATGRPRRPQLVRRRRRLDRLRRAARPHPRGARSRAPSGAATRPARSRTRSSSSAPPRRCCRTATPPPGRPARWPGPRSTRTRSRRCCAASRCTTRAGSPTS